VTRDHGPGHIPDRGAPQAPRPDPPHGRGDGPSAAPGRLPQPEPDLRPQVIDDAAGRTIAAASSLEKELRSAKGTKTERAKAVGTLVAQRAKAAGVERVVFDRAGFRYHGRVKSLAEAAREAGLDF